MGLEQSVQTTFANSYRYVLAGLGLVEPDATRVAVCAALDHPQRFLDAYQVPGEELSFRKRAELLRADVSSYRHCLPETINEALRTAWGRFGPQNIETLRPVFTALLLYFSANDFATPTLRVPGERSSLWNLSHRDIAKTAGVPRLPGTRPGALTFHELLGRMREEGLAMAYGVGDVRLSRDVWLKAPQFKSRVVDSATELESICLRLEENGNFAQAVAELFVKGGLVVSVPVAHKQVSETQSNSNPEGVQTIHQGLMRTYTDLVIQALGVASGMVKFLVDPDSAVVYFLKVGRL